MMDRDLRSLERFQDPIKLKLLQRRLGQGVYIQEAPRPIQVFNDTRLFINLPEYKYENKNRDGIGYGFGFGHGYSDGSGYGCSHGCQRGSGYGDGDGFGSGFGFGDGKGFGFGYGSGAGSESGESDYSYTEKIRENYD